MDKEKLIVELKELEEAFKPSGLNKYYNAITKVIAYLQQEPMGGENIFPLIKSSICDCICRAVNICNGKITEEGLNTLGNECADKILAILPKALTTQAEEFCKCGLSNEPDKKLYTHWIDELGTHCGKCGKIMKPLLENTYCECPEYQYPNNTIVHTSPNTPPYKSNNLVGISNNPGVPVCGKCLKPRKEPKKTCSNCGNNGKYTQCGVKLLCNWQPIEQPKPKSGIEELEVLFPQSDHPVYTTDLIDAMHKVKDKLNKVIKELNSLKEEKQ